MEEDASACRSSPALIVGLLSVPRFLLSLGTADGSQHAVGSIHRSRIFLRVIVLWRWPVLHPECALNVSANHELSTLVRLGLFIARRDCWMEDRGKGVILARWVTSLG